MRQVIVSCNEDKQKFPVRIVTWNTCQKTDARVSRIIEKFKPDILVAPETSRTPNLQLPDVVGTYHHIWTNTEKSGRTIPTKGLGIFSRSDFKLIEVTDSLSQAPTSLVGRIETPSTEIDILAIWIQPLPRRTMHGTYMQSLANIFDAHSHVLIFAQSSINQFERFPSRWTPAGRCSAN